MSVEEQLQLHLQLQLLETRTALTELTADLAEFRLDMTTKLDALIADVRELRADCIRHTHSD